MKENREILLQRIIEELQELNVEALEAAMEETDTRFYGKSDTMKMIGYQSSWRYVMPGGEFHAGFKDIMESFTGNSDIFIFAINMFSYGTICGKRIERSGRKAAYINEKQEK